VIVLTTEIVWVRVNRRVRVEVPVTCSVIETLVDTVRVIRGVLLILRVRPGLFDTELLCDTVRVIFSERDTPGVRDARGVDEMVLEEERDAV
jgi:hypothetical protein